MLPEIEIGAALDQYLPHPLLKTCRFSLTGGSPTINELLLNVTNNIERNWGS
jgi:hypothetical protein